MQIGLSIGDLSDWNQEEHAAILQMIICSVEVIFGSARPAVQWKDRLSLGNGFHLVIRQVGSGGVLAAETLREGVDGMIVIQYYMVYSI